MTHKLYINRSPVSGPWGGGNKALQAFHSEQREFCISSFAPDAVLAFGLDAEVYPSAESLVDHKNANPNTKLVLRVNDCDARKATTGVDKRWISLSRYADKTIFVSQWMQDYYVRRGWVCKDNTVIVNGVDRSVFKPACSKPTRQHLSIVTAHWSDNPLKGADIAEWLDEFAGEHPDLISYTYVGRTKSKLKNTRLIPPLGQESLASELVKHDVCINASRFDPGPNSVLESIACGLPTWVHVDGGGCCEFAGDDHVFRDTDELRSLLLSRERITQKNTKCFEPTDWCTYVDRCVRFMFGDP